MSNYENANNPDFAAISGNVQHLVAEICNDYKNWYPEEYTQYCKEQNKRRAVLDNVWAEVQHTDTIIRQLGELPETLYYMFKSRLSDDDFKWLFQTKEGYTWFYRKFPEYLTTKSV